MKIQISDIASDLNTQVRAFVVHRDQVEHLRQALKESGDLDPIHLMEIGGKLYIADGHHRVEAYKAEGREEIPAKVQRGSLVDALCVGFNANSRHGRSLSHKEKRAAIRRLRIEMDNPKVATIAKMIDASEATVRRVFSDMDRELGEPTEGQEGNYKKQLNFDEALAPDLKGATDDSYVMGDGGYDVSDVQRAGAGDEWYTPAVFLAAAKNVMGGIDLDPASSAKANETVQASQIFTQADDGLSKAWNGRVWLNPPYSNAGAWVEKCLEEYERGNISQAIILINSKTETRYVQRCFRHTGVFVERRIRFVDGHTGLVSGSGRSGSIIVYLGDRVVRFVSEFGENDAGSGVGTAWTFFDGSLQTLRTKSKGRCEDCGKPCSSGRWCPHHKQLRRQDRAWKIDAKAEAERLIFEGVDILQHTTSFCSKIKAPRKEVLMFLSTLDYSDEVKSQLRERARGQTYIGE